MKKQKIIQWILATVIVILILALAISPFSMEGPYGHGWHQEEPDIPYSCFVSLWENDRQYLCEIDPRHSSAYHCIEGFWREESGEVFRHFRIYVRKDGVVFHQLKAETESRIRRGEFVKEDPDARIVFHEIEGKVEYTLSPQNGFGAIRFSVPRKVLETLPERAGSQVRK